MTAKPTVDFNYDLIPSGYYDKIFRRRRGVQSKWHHLKFQRVQAELCDGCAHLDVACGPGTFIGTLPATISSIGVDVAAAQIDYANRLYSASNREFRTMYPAALPFDDSRFDAVTAVELIEHIPDVEAGRLLMECRRVLKSGGKVVVTTPNYAAFWPMIESALNRFGSVSYEDQHITKYRPASLAKLLADAELVSIRVETFLLSAPFMAAISWRLADFATRIEPGFITRKMGHLLVGIAHKP